MASGRGLSLGADERGDHRLTLTSTRRIFGLTIAAGWEETMAEALEAFGFLPTVESENFA